MATRTAIINVMAKACYKASRNLLRDFGEVEQLQASRRGPKNFVDTANHASENNLLNELTFARPDYGLITKSGKNIESRDPKKRRWFVDPLNGSQNFLHGVPHWAISIALEEEDQIVAGVIYDATKDELFWAEKGVGAFLNDTRLRVSERRTLSECLVSIGKYRSSGYPGFVEELCEEVSGIRNFASESLDLAYVAAGRIDGFWQSEVDSWEIAAGIIMIKEAGGYATDFSGRNQMMTNGTIICANARVHHRILKLSKSVKSPA